MARKGRQPASAKFKVGDRVRVKHGVKDQDYPDLPMGGWAGTIVRSDKPGTYEIRWTQETLDRIHPVFKTRCERDGLTLEECGLGEDDLEPDAGGPIKIEHPTEIRIRPLSPKDQDDRVRMVFGLTSDDPLPDVDDETLETYHEHLSNSLVFPFLAEYGAEYGHPERVKVIGLGDPDDEPMIDEDYGILCEARVEGKVVTLPLGELEEPSRNRKVLRDYCYWFHNWS